MFRHNLKKLVIVGLSATVFSVSLPAAEEFGDSVPIDVVRAFLGNVTNEGPKLYRDVMEDFPAFTLPGGVEVLGSLDQGYAQQVVLRSNTDTAAAVASLKQSLVAEGWLEIPVFNPAAAQRGFVSGQSYVFPEMFCEPEQGNIQLSSNDGIIKITRSLGPQSQDCEQSAASAARMSQFESGVRKYMPIMEVPGDSRMPPFSMALGSGSSGENEAEARYTLNDERTIKEVYNFLKVQVEDQEWLLDSENLSDLVATGTWRKSVPDMELIGMLTVTSISDDSFDLRFRVVRPGAGRGGQRGFFQTTP